jgi:GMP synthase (glutamine-hydrolysing)
MKSPLIGILKVGTTRLSDARARRGGDYDAWFREALEPLGARSVTVDAVAGPLPSQVHWDGLIITGGPSSVHNREPWSEAAGAWVAARIREGMPTLGVCYGHQLIADALGGESVPNPGGPEVGNFEVEVIEDDPIFRGMPRPFHAHLIHFDAVTRLPKGARALARSAATEFQAFAVGEHVRCVQWHPEFDAGGTREAVGQDAEALRRAGHDPVDAAAGVVEIPYRTRIIENFVRLFV